MGFKMLFKDLEEDLKVVSESSSNNNKSTMTF